MKNRLKKRENRRIYTRLKNSKNVEFMRVVFYRQIDQNCGRDGCWNSNAVRAVFIAEITLFDSKIIIVKDRTQINWFANNINSNNDAALGDFS